MSLLHDGINDTFADAHACGEQIESSLRLMPP
jgi:hypothetical protein